MEKNIKILEIDDNQRTDDFYQGFREKLEETHTFPTSYMFKYIATSTNQEAISKLHSIFKNPDARISTKESKTGKYTSITITIPVNDVDDIIIYYKQASEIEGIMAL